MEKEVRFKVCSLYAVHLRAEVQIWLVVLYILNDTD